MKSLVLFVCVGIAAVVLAAGYPPYVKKTLYATNDFRGKPAPKLAVESWLSGSAPSTKDKVVLIDFWATWCPPCRELVGELNGWSEKFGKKLAVIGVSSEDRATVQKFMGDHKMAYNVAVDPSDRMAHEVGVQGIPHVLVISPDGIVRWQGFPQNDVDPLTTEKLSQIIDEAEAKR